MSPSIRGLTHSEVESLPGDFAERLTGPHDGAVAEIPPSPVDYGPVVDNSVTPAGEAATT